MATQPQGQGKDTSTKIYFRFQPTLDIILSAMKKHPGQRVVADFHGGSGFNDEAQCIGSPLIELAALADQPWPANLMVFEIDPDRRKLLTARLAGLQSDLGASHVTWRVEPDHTDITVLSAWADGIPRRLLRGVTLLDPNGAIHQSTLRSAVYLAGRPGWAKVDSLIHYSATSLKRNRGVARGTTDKAPLFTEWADSSASAWMAQIGKEYWWITKPSDQGQRTFLFGTNWNKFPGLVRYGFQPVRSPIGADWLAEAEDVRAVLPPGVHQGRFEL